PAHNRAGDPHLRITCSEGVARSNHAAGRRESARHPDYASSNPRTRRRFRRSKPTAPAAAPTMARPVADPPVGESPPGFGGAEGRPGSTVSRGSGTVLGVGAGGVGDSV